MLLLLSKTFHELQNNWQNIQEKDYLLTSFLTRTKIYPESLLPFLHHGCDTQLVRYLKWFINSKLSFRCNVSLKTNEVFSSFSYFKYENNYFRLAVYPTSKMKKSPHFLNIIQFLSKILLGSKLNILKTGQRTSQIWP